MRILLEANANTRARDIYGNNALWFATRLEHVAVIDLLKEATQREAVRTVRSRIHFRDDDNVTHPAPLDTDMPPKKHRIVAQAKRKAEHRRARRLSSERGQRLCVHAFLDVQ